MRLTIQIIDKGKYIKAVFSYNPDKISFMFDEDYELLLSKGFTIAELKGGKKLPVIHLTKSQYEDLVKIFDFKFEIQFLSIPGSKIHIRTANL